MGALRFLMDLPGVEPAHPQHRFCLPIGCSGSPPSVYTHLISELSAYCVGLRQAHAFASPRFFSSTRRDRTGRLPEEHPTTSFGFYYKGRQRRNIAMPLPFRTEPTFASGKFATLPPAIRSGAKRFFSSGGRTRTGGLVVMSHASYQLLYPASGSGTALS